MAHTRLDASWVKDDVAGDMQERSEEILTDEALAFRRELHQKFDSTRRDLLARRQELRDWIKGGGRLDFLS